MSSILNQLQSKGSNLSNLNGADGPKPDFKQSKVHYDYSINGNPALTGKPSPSVLDLEGTVPPYNYRDNSPENRTF